MENPPIKGEDGSLENNSLYILQVLPDVRIVSGGEDGRIIIWDGEKIKKNIEKNKKKRSRKKQKKEKKE